MSPINQQCRDLLAAVRADLAGAGVDLPVYWGNRNWHPMLTDTVARMADDGVRRALAFVTSAYSSYSSCGVYVEDVEAARAAVGDRAPVVDKIRQFYDHPGFVEPLARSTEQALRRLPEEERAGARLVFDAHSIPTRMSDTSGPAGGAYPAQVVEAARLVAERAAPQLPWDVAWCSRSGPPSQPWLEPDVCDHLEELRDKGVRAVAIVPVGFVSDHMEVIYDLDTEALAKADEIGMHAVRVPAVGVAPEFVSMVRELVLERTDAAPRRALGTLGPQWDRCAPGCCA